MMPMSLATAAKENCAWPPAPLMPDPFPLPGGRFQLQTWLGSIDWVQLCFSVQKPPVVGSIGAGVGSPRLAGADHHHSGAAIHSLSRMILCFYLRVCGVF